MLFWWICGGESVLPVLLLCHLGSSPFVCFQHLFLKPVILSQLSVNGPIICWWALGLFLCLRCCCSVGKSCLTLWPPWTHQAPLSFISPRICSDSSPLSQLCHPTASSFVVPFFSCSQSFPASGYFLMSQLFTSGGQSFSFGASASASVLPMNIQGWFPLELTGLISLLSKGLLSLLQKGNPPTLLVGM